MSLLLSILFSLCLSLQAGQLVALSWEPPLGTYDVWWYWIYSRSSSKSDLDLRHPYATGHQTIYSTRGTSITVEANPSRINYFWITAVHYDLTQSEPTTIYLYIFENKTAVNP